MESKRGFQPGQYREVGQDQLVVTALAFLLEESKQASFENLVAEAFLSFPERFQLEGYPEWPNANVINKSWVRCRTGRNWISGSASEGFSLTRLGEQVAERTLASLNSKAPRKATTRPGSRQTISSRVVLRIESSPAYRKYTTTGIGSVTDFDFCELLYCTLESGPGILERNFSVVRQETAGYGRKDLLEFLDKLRQHFAARFTGKRTRGGLMPQKKKEA